MESSINTPTQPTYTSLNTYVFGYSWMDKPGRLTVAAHSLEEAKQQLLDAAKDTSRCSDAPGCYAHSFEELVNIRNTLIQWKLLDSEEKTIPEYRCICHVSYKYPDGTIGTKYQHDAEQLWNTFQTYEDFVKAAIPSAVYPVRWVQHSSCLDG